MTTEASERSIAAAAVGHAAGERRGTDDHRLGYRPLLFCALLASSYVVTGRLGLLLAVPPGYATAIFPPAGIAAAAMLVGGPASLPWTFLGSLILNLWVGHDVGKLETIIMGLAAVLIAASSTVQAALTGTMLQRAIGYPAAFDDGRQVRRFLLLPPLCCLTSATVSLGGLWILGVVSARDAAPSWVAWWVGDTLGVLIMLPLVLVLIGEPRPLWRARLRPVALPMLLFFGLFVAIFIRVSAWEDDERLLQFRLVSQQALDKIRARLEEQEVFLEQLERSFAGSATPITRADFAGLVQSALRRFPTLQAVEWAPAVTQANRRGFEAAQQVAERGFEIREIARRGPPRRAATRGVYYPVSYIAPMRGNEQALGLDLAANPGRADAVAAALASGAVSATLPIRLVQETAQQSGLLLLKAVRGGPSGAGLLLVVLRMGSFVDAGLGSMESTLRLRLVDTAHDQALYDGFGNSMQRPRYRQEFDFGLRHYAVETEPTAAYLASRRGWQSWLLLAAGVFGTGMLGGLLLLGTGYAHRIQAQVDERTRDLAAANRQLRIEVAERHSAEVALRQAQRMEAIGRLTGGIAHDFNNLLTVVSANAELLRDPSLGDRVQRRVAAILRAADRGERLTRHLLAFSRQHALRAEAVDLRRRTPEIAELLSRTLRDDIEIVLDVPGDLWPVAIDPGELELAILNIAVNARDAMPGGGQFRVAARNLSASAEGPIGEGLVGDYVGLTFADTGSGMMPEVLAHAFDPYFTTKEVGAGSGLGLSQVYGFVKQSGGSATIASKAGGGTSVCLFLPRAEREAGIKAAPASGVAASGG